MNDLLFFYGENYETRNRTTTSQFLLFIERYFEKQQVTQADIYYYRYIHSVYAVVNLKDNIELHLQPCSR